MKTQALQRLCIYLLTQLCLFSSDVEAVGCVFPKQNGNITDKELMEPIQLLVGKRYLITEEEHYKYYIGICTDGVVKGEEGGYFSGAGVLQRKIGNQITSAIIIGKYTAAKIEKGTDWVILEYEEGTAYGSHCGQEKRRARIFITCDSKVKLGQEVIRILEINSGTKDCYYSIEMASSVTCKKESLLKEEPVVTANLSLGTIMLIIILPCAVILIIAGGCLYIKFVSRDNENIVSDNVLRADNCKCVCVSRFQQGQQSYKDVGDDKLNDHDRLLHHM